MSTHPNAMLLLALTPDDTARKTYRAILEESGVKADGGSFEIGGTIYHHHGVMEDTWEENNQLSLPEGTIYVMDLVTYGYGDKVTWDKLVTQKAALDEWAKGICERHCCTAEVFVGANYW